MKILKSGDKLQKISIRLVKLSEIKQMLDMT